MAAQQQPRPVISRDVTLARILLFISCILFVIAALAAGNVIQGQAMWAWAFGAFAAWVLSGAV